MKVSLSFEDRFALEQELQWEFRNGKPWFSEI